MLNSLILDGGFQRGNVEIETLPAEPVGPVLIKCVRVALPNSLKEGELVLPLWPYRAVCRELRPDAGSFKTPVRPQTVLLLVESQVRVPPLKERHDDPGEVQEKFELGRYVAALFHVLDVPPDIDCLGRVVVEGQTALELGKLVGQIGRAEDRATGP